MSWDLTLDDIVDMAKNELRKQKIIKIYGNNTNNKPV